MRGSDRAVSDLVAFILVFALIIASVGILYSAGFQSMRDYQEGEQLRNADRAVGTLAAHLNDVLRTEGVEERAGELVLRGGRFTVENETTNLQINVSPAQPSKWDNSTDGNVTDVGAITYAEGSATIGYEGGAVFRRDDAGNSVMLERPQFTCDTDAMGGDGAAVVSVMKVDSPTRSVQSDGSIEVGINQQESDTYVFHDVNGINVTHAESANSNGWEMALKRGDWSYSGTTGTCEADHVTVRIVTVDVYLSTDD